MVVQFRCPSCEKPIEIDDEYAGRQVTCPYCHDVVDAPTESTYQSEPVARPVGETQPPPPPAGEQQSGEGPAFEPAGSAGQTTPGVDVTVSDRFEPWAQPPGQMRGPAPQRRNIVGFVGLGLALVSLVLAFASVQILMVQHGKELGFDNPEELKRAEIQKRFTEMNQNIDKHPWLVRVYGYMMGSMFCWLVGLICSIVGLSARYRSRLPGVLGLISSLILPLLMCSGLLAG